VETVGLGLVSEPHGQICGSARRPTPARIWPRSEPHWRADTKQCRRCWHKASGDDALCWNENRLESVSRGGRAIFGSRMPQSSALR
jgi:hypothetical protein